MQAISRTVFLVSMMAGLSCAVAKAGDAARFVVSPKGGEGQFATLQAACQAARKAGTDKPGPAHTKFLFR
jgi:pectin methylesterase-like acyl-CoA thioesterase